MRPSFLAILLLLSLFSFSAAGCAALSAERGAGKGTPTSFFELPGALQKDPGSLRIEPLKFEPPEPRVEKLPNGMTVYLVPDRTVPLVQFHALVSLGNLDDPPEKVGLTQVTWTTLQTGGAGTRSAEEVDRVLEDMAALVGADAGDESADFAMESRTADFDKALALFVDLLRRPRFEPAALARVLDQGRDAVARRQDDAGHVAQVSFVQALWGVANPFAREPTLETLAAITRDDLVELHRRAVVPGAIRLVVTGDIEPDLALQKIAQQVADWPAGTPLARKLPQAPPKKAREVVIVPTSGAQAKIRLGHLGPARHDPRDYAVRLLDAVLGGGEGSSRLYSEIRDKRGLAYTVESSIGPGPVRGLVVLAADTKPENAREVIARCIEEMEGIRGAKPPTEAEVALAREAAINAYAFRFDTAPLAAYLRAQADQQGYPADYFKTFRARLTAVTAEQVAAVAREVLDPGALEIVVVGDPERIGDLSEYGPVRTVYGGAKAGQ
ncbi:MAG TPA: pitrilysin family protein [Myxococcales bacterium]